MKRIVLLLVCHLLVSCESRTDALRTLSDSQYDDIIEISQMVDRNRRLPGEIYLDIKSLIDEVRGMSHQEIDALDDDRLFYLTTPLNELREGSINLPDHVTTRLRGPKKHYLDFVKSDSSDGSKHKEFRQEISEILQNYRSEFELREKLSSEEILDLFREWKSGTGFELTCSTLFNRNNVGVILVPGDNLKAAHTFCEDVDLFLLSEGSYFRQMVEDVRKGTVWVGLGHVRLDGLNVVETAFISGMSQSYFGWLEIANYTSYGIKSIDKEGVFDVTIEKVWFNQIGREADGQKHGAVEFEWGTHIRVISSRFTNVTSSIRFLNSKGPLLVAENEAVNTGRNFFQCDKCSGEGILVEKNSMEQYGQSGTNKLEDFINIFNSVGTPDHFIRIRGNRARTDGSGNGVSKTGSFIILGDHGGGYQVAEDNIGVSPGNVGIGAAGGHNIHIMNNVMYSEPIKGISNVAYYSYMEPPDQNISCNNHVSEGNRAYWFCFSAACGSENTALLNKAYSPTFKSFADYCGLVNEEINADESVLEDPTLTEDIWHNF